MIRLYRRASLPLSCGPRGAAAQAVRVTATVMAVLVSVLPQTGCGSSDGGALSGSGGMASGTGGNGGSGGNNNASGTGGTVAGTGGNVGTGGDVTATGGAIGSGGSAPGGNPGSAGVVGSGGSGASGGAGGTGSGGSSGGSGGSVAATGGTNGMTACQTFGASARSKCTGTSTIACHFGGATGNYNVSVVLGGSGAGKTEVQTEAYRELLQEADTAAGKTQCYSFTINVRQPEGQPVENGPNDGTPGLDMYFVGPAAALTDITYAPVSTPPTVVYIAGDSTVCDDSGADGNYSGWGQEFPVFFGQGLSVANYADSGESAAGFGKNSALWGAIMAAVKPNDYVLIQFGHNDKTAADAAAYKTNMTKYVTDVKSKNANPILITPASRAQFTGNTVNSQHIVSGVNYPQVVKDIGAAENVPVIDLTDMTTKWLTQVGPNGWQKYHAVSSSNNKADPTHTNRLGAQVNAAFIRDGINQLNIAALKKFLR